VSLYLYALSGTPGTAATGLSGEALQWISCAGIFAAVGELEMGPAVEAAAVKGHDLAVRALAQSVEGLLPARFGSVVRDAAALEQALVPQLPALREALVLVAGREQMTLRVFGPPEEHAPAVNPTGPGAGTRYLQQRQQAERARHQAPELEPIRVLLSGVIAAERIERGTSAGLRATAYHLIARGQSARYREAIAHVSLAPLTLAVSGPWPAYAFAPGALP
jgi:hypothetical protein